MARVNDNFDALPCGKCGYDLRATAMDANCPECGTPAVNTLAGYRVDGDCLVVRDGARLPSRCGICNYTGAECDWPGIPGTIMQVLIQPWAATVKASAASTRLRVMALILCGVAGVAFLLLMLNTSNGDQLNTFGKRLGILIIGFSLAMVVAFVLIAWRRGSVSIYSYRSHVGSIRCRLVTWSVLIVCFALATCVTYFGWIRFGDREIQFVGILYPVPLALAMFLFREHGVRVVKSRDGEYWMKGFSRAFLRSCEIERKRLLSETAAAQLSPPLKESQVDAADV